MNQNLLNFLCFILIVLNKRNFFSISTKPSPSSEAISFDWSNLIESCLHSSVPFQIVVNVTARWILCTIVDKGASISILSSTAWQALCSPHLVPSTDHILDFNRRPTAPLGTLPYLPITLGGKTINQPLDIMFGRSRFESTVYCWFQAR